MDPTSALAPACRIALPQIPAVRHCQYHPNNVGDGQQASKAAEDSGCYRRRKVLPTLTATHATLTPKCHLQYPAIAQYDPDKVGGTQEDKNCRETVS